MAALAFKVKRGETRRWTLTLTNDDGSAISGALSNPRSEWRNGRTDTDPVIAVFGTDTPCDITGSISAAGNVITLLLDNSMSKQLTPGTYKFDVFVDLDGEPFCVSGDQAGTVQVTQNITVPE